MSRRFRGGIHPEDNKHTRNEAIQSLEMPERLIISLSQHIGAPARPVVSVGDRVLKFQMVAEPGGFVSAAMHAPTSGTVKTIGPSPHPSGNFIPAVVIEPDGKDEAMDLSDRADPDLKKGPDAWKGMIRDAGIVGMGGAAFPTHVKLSPPAEKPIDVVIANGVECEPFLTSDHRVMLESPKEVIEGILIAMEIVGAKRGIIGIEANKPDAVDIMRESGLPENVTVEVLPLMYPQGAEKQ
ncbi:MAG: RnfABCDGE type electron transport complex subunit C, partial [Proteobacteria bacterium]|nr:RnfABCDGE type electron transport complex subunit C [Pseudomonadota bacterium]